MDILGLIALVRSKGGGSGGTTNYNQLTNKPSINNVQLSGNKTAHDLGLAAQTDIPTVPVQSVNGKTGAVNLTSGDIAYDESATYQAGSVGAELQEQTRQLSDKQNSPSTAGTPGQVLSLDSNLDPVWVDQTGGTTGLTILSYGHSTWANFLAAYNANRVVYCRASSSDNPGSGSQNRLAFLAYVQGTADRPTGAEFQYYRSVSSHTAEQQGDQIYVYTLSNKGIWDVTTREASTAIAAGTNLSQAYSNGTLTLSFDGTGYITAPATAGTAGQVLGLDSNLNPAWVDQSGGGGINIVNLSGTQITQVGADNTFYVCGELTELTFTAPAVGITMIRFTSGTTPTVLTVNGVTSWMYDNDPTTASLEANKTYDINVLNGVGVVGWA